MKLIDLMRNGLISAVLALISSSASAALITFEDVSPENGATNVVSTGFNFQSGFDGWLYSPPGGIIESVFGGNPHDSMRLAGSGDSGGGGKVNLPGPGVRMTQVGGGDFDVFGFDATTFSTIQPSDTLTVVGTFLLGGTISTSFGISTSFNSFALAGFTDLVSIDFYSTVGAGFPQDGFQIDNISTVAAVPEPGTFAMLLASLGLLGFHARRPKQKEAAA